MFNGAPHRLFLNDTQSTVIIIPELALDVAREEAIGVIQDFRKRIRSYYSFNQATVP